MCSEVDIIVWKNRNREKPIPRFIAKNDQNRTGNGNNGTVTALVISNDLSDLE